MIESLLGVPGKLKTLLDRLTAARATKLDNLDTAITTRAPSSTALSTATWTATRAGYLDGPISNASKHAKLIATGYLSTTRSGTGSGEDVSYYDVTISGVTDAANCVVDVGLMQFYAVADSYPPSSAFTVTGRLTSAVNLRIACARDDAARIFRGRYYIWELERT